ncbi:sugar transferase [Niabella ginsengisoli]|uniref:sugar transferase n=1 Tax=Niabella ginsengisoli TaxID=522298 RepID=UPI00293EC502|nr:sugar transferase [Niabella ginsengisoli]
MKRLTDILISFWAMVILLPVVLIVAINILVNDKGPVIYKQKRVGKDGKLFYIYKFRSMVVDAEPNGPQLSSDDDIRVTRLGRTLRKWRLDELPQLWNIFIGDMSLVGPRAERLFLLNK